LLVKIVAIECFQGKGNYWELGIQTVITFTILQAPWSLSISGNCMVDTG